MQNTIASFTTFIPTLEEAFTAAGIAERKSWAVVGDSLLAQLEAETEVVRQQYVASQLQPPADQQSKPAATVKGTSTGQDIPKPASKDASDPAEQPGGGTQNLQGTVKVIQLPQDADEDDAVDLDEVGDGKAGSKVPAALSPSDEWNGDVL